MTFSPPPQPGMPIALDGPAVAAAGSRQQTPAATPIYLAVNADSLRPRPPGEIDWPRWIRVIERKRRALRPAGRRASAVWPGWVYRDGTRASFGLEGIVTADADLADALAPGRPLRSRLARRLRAHLAILRSLDHCRHHDRCLTAGHVLRWYTSVSGGLSTDSPGPATRDRLAAIVQRVNSPQRRLQPAVTEAARLHAELLADPLFPGFNGIVARLLLHAHLAGSGLPPVVFDSARDHWPTPTPAFVTACLLERLDATLDRLGATG